MSIEKRKVATDALETLGSIIDTNAKRDAIHLAVEPCIAGEDLKPGSHIGIVNGYATTKAPTKLGIVDPFIQDYVMKDERFWLIVYPRTITSLRHVWEHPAFKEKEKEEVPFKRMKLSELLYDGVDSSRDWIRSYASELDGGEGVLDYEVLMNGADDFIFSLTDVGGYGNYLTLGGLLEGVSTSPEFWEHYEKVRGIKVEENHKHSFFSCSC